MTLIFFTSESSLSNNFTRYYLQELKREFPDLLVVSVKKKKVTSLNNRLESFLKLIKRKWDMWTWGYFIEYFVSYPIKIKLGSLEFHKINRRFGELVSYKEKELFHDRIIVNSPNGHLTISEIKRHRPDIIIQAGAGLLKQDIIDIPKLGVINIHHGIAPLIKGMDSIYWAKWTNNIDWLGATLHYIDSGIDTGKVIKYIYPSKTNLYSSSSEIFFELSVNAIDHLRYFLIKLKFPNSNDIILDDQKNGLYNYKSSLTGIRMLIILIRDKYRKTK